MQIKQHAPEQPMGQRRNQKGTQKNHKINEMEMKHTKTYEMLPNLFREGSLQ